MPQYDLRDQTNPDQLRIMLLGPAFHRKTWWAADCASFGFNVIFLDSDGKVGIISKLPAEVRKRIFTVDVTDEITNAVASLFVTRVLKQEQFLWNETDKQTQYIIKTADPKKFYVSVDPSKLTFNDIVVFDSWTADIRSLQLRYTIDQKIDISAKSIIDSNFKDYRWTGAMADKWLADLKKLNCHVIVVCHETSFEKKEKDADGDNKEKLLFSRMQPVSTSNNQGMRMAKEFTDILYFSTVGDQIYIDTRNDANRDGGSINLPMEKKKWEDMRFKRFLEVLPHLKPSGASQAAFKFYAPGELVVPAVAPVVQVTTPALQLSTAAASNPALIVPAAKQGTTTLAGLFKKQ